MLFKKDKEKARQELENAADDVMQELDEDTMQEFSGAGNPFADVARVPTQEYTDDIRGRV